MKLKEFTFKKVQQGFWGEHVKRILVVRAECLEAAEAVIAARPDFYRRLANGDCVTWYHVA